MIVYFNILLFYFSETNCFEQTISRLKAISDQRWFKICVAWLGWILYNFDVGSDIWVSVKLMLTCHYYYGTAVLIAVLLPGIIYGWLRFSGDKSVKDFFKALVWPVWIIPLTWWSLLKAAIDLYRKKDMSNGSKG